MTVPTTRILPLALALACSTGSAPKRVDATPDLGDGDTSDTAVDETDRSAETGDTGAVDTDATDSGDTDTGDTSAADSGDSGTADTDPDPADTDTASTNRPPKADAGPDQEVEIGSTVQLNGGGSSDPDGDSLEYTWQVSGPTGGVQLSGASNPATAISPSFLASTVGFYNVWLTVSDGDLISQADRMIVQVRDSMP